MVVFDTITFLAGYQPFHQGRVGRCDPHRAVIAVAFERLNATQRQHHATGGITSICTQCQSFQQVEPGSHFATGDHRDAVTQAITDQCVVNEDQAFHQWGADVV